MYCHAAIDECMLCEGKIDIYYAACLCVDYNFGHVVGTYTRGGFYEENKKRKN